MESNKPLGCLSGMGIMITIAVLAIIVVLILIGGGAIFNPGDLSAKQGTEQLGGVSAHSDLSKDCSSCHAAPWSNDRLTDRCSVCHTKITTEIENSSGLHGAMIKNKNVIPCNDCHTEHNGSQASLTLTGYLFPHRKATGYSLRSHQTMDGKEPLGCSDCHITDISSFKVETCVACHNDLDATFTSNHINFFSNDCIACHDGKDSYGKNFDHNLTGLPLKDGHSEATCDACHKNMVSIADFQAADAACQTCHLKDDAHDGGFGQNCAVCHTADDWENVTEFNHALSSFQLTGAHTNTKCEKCHINNVFKNTPTRCYDCHKNADEHNGGMGSDCAACHSTGDWDNVDFSHSFPINHFSRRAWPCEDCHIDPNNIKIYSCLDGCHAHSIRNLRGEHPRDFEDCLECHPRGYE